MTSSLRGLERKTCLKTELYLNLTTSWYEIWETVRTWLTKSPHSQFGRVVALPNKIANGSYKWSATDEQLKAVQITNVLTITYEKSREGVDWTTTLYFKRAKRSIYSHLTVEASQSDVTVKPPRIVPMLKRRFGQMNKTKKPNLRLLTNKSSDDNLSEKIVAKLSKQPLPARLVDVAPSAGKSLRAAMKDPGGRPPKINSGAHPFITSCDDATHTITMKVYDAKGKLVEFPFKITSKTCWFVIRQFTDAKSTPVVLKKPKGRKTLNLKSMFRKAKGDNRDSFYNYIYTAKIGSKAAYELRQIPKK